MMLPDISMYTSDSPEARSFGMHPLAYSDPAIFALEQEHIFKRCWQFLTLESEIPNSHDFVTTRIANTSIIVSRGRDGAVRGFLNACPHKGSAVCLREKGQARAHVCPYHAWTFDSSGKLIGIRDRSSGNYEPAFLAGDHNLVAVRVESYRGFLFGTLDEEAPTLDEYLGDMRFFIDVILDRYPDGIELVPGRATYTFRGNWKLQLENGLDSYHLHTAHKTFLDIVARRRRGKGNQTVKEVDWGDASQLQHGIYGFRHGHVLMWQTMADLNARPDTAMIKTLQGRIDPLKAAWMERGRVYTIFPNLQIQDFQSLMLRVFRPVRENFTEMTTYCLAPIGESTEARDWRLRQYEDFFNPGGLATPDDSVIYEWCQQGYAATGMDYTQGFARGIGAMHSGGNSLSDEADLSPLTSSISALSEFNETGAVGCYREWMRLLQSGTSASRAAAA